VDGESRGRGEDVVYVMAGLADLGLSRVEGALRGLRSVLKRPDLRELTRDGHADLRARGELAMKRYMPAPEARLERLARLALARRGPNVIHPDKPDTGA
jgi:hypothetical protein